MESLVVLFVKLLSTGLSPSNVKNMSAADFTVLGMLTSLLLWEVKSQKMYAKIVSREEVSANPDGASRLVYMPMKAVMNMVSEERC
jgi:hypothetical protein